MSLKHSILVLLARSPGSGYELAQRFRQGIGYFWNASHQQVYQELKRLAQDKLVEFEVEAQADRPDKKVHRLTAAGRRELRRWLAEPAKPPRVRDALLVKMFGADPDDPAPLLAELARHRQLYEKQLAAFQAMEREYREADAGRRRGYLLPYLTLRRGILHTESWLRWADEVRAALALRTPIP